MGLVLQYYVPIVLQKLQRTMLICLFSLLRNKGHGAGFVKRGRNCAGDIHEVSRTTFYMILWMHVHSVIVLSADAQRVLIMLNNIKVIIH